MYGPVTPAAPAPAPAPLSEGSGSTVDDECCHVSPGEEGMSEADDDESLTIAAILQSFQHQSALPASSASLY
ncbi:hypothetical protein EJB05_09433, partial [Eragrostis curvula]